MAPPTGNSQQTQAMLAAVWNKNRDLVLQRVETIENLCRALPAAASDTTLRSAAAADAHKLAGSLGMFGLSQGTALARSIEHHLNDDAPEALLDADLPSLAHQLREMIQTYSIPVEAPLPVRRSKVLILESDAELANEIYGTAKARGMDARIAKDLEVARERLQAEPFDVLVLDLATAELTRGRADDSAEQIRDLILSRAPMQILALTSVDTFEDRVTAAQVGAHGFLPKTVPVPEIVDTCEHLLDLQSAQFKVLTVDDDATVLNAVKMMLEQHSIKVASLSDPRLFWKTLEETQPDLVILDLEMPNFSGLELCRAIRNDSQWNRLPVLFLSVSSDAQTVTSIFSAGADDFVPKPIIDIELTTRVRNRLDRDRLYRNLSDYDQLTNVRNRRSSNVVIANYLRLAERHALPVSLVVLDLDKFKRVNDTYGHQAGDDVLQYLGGLLRQSFRSEDVVARWGGEEFVVAMFAMRRGDAIERIANVLERLEAHEFELSAGTRFRVSFSAGLAEFPGEGRDLHSLYRLADEALYRAKKAGGRRIYASSSTSARVQTDIAIVSSDVTLSAPLRHALEMRGYAVEIFHKPDVALHDLTAGGHGTGVRVVLIDEAFGAATFELLSRLRAALDAHATLLLLCSETGAEPLPAWAQDVERINKPLKHSLMMQRVRRALAR